MFVDISLLNEDQDIFEFLREGTTESCEGEEDSLEEGFNLIVEMAEAELKLANFMSESTIAFIQAKTSTVLNEDGWSMDNFKAKSKQFLSDAKNKIANFLSNIDKFLTDICEKIRNSAAKITKLLSGETESFIRFLNTRGMEEKIKSKLEESRLCNIEKALTSVHTAKQEYDKFLKSGSLKEKISKKWKEFTGDEEYKEKVDQLKQNFEDAVKESKRFYASDKDIERASSGDPKKLQKAITNTIKEINKVPSKSATAKKAAEDMTKKMKEVLKSGEVGNTSILGRIVSLLANFFRNIFGAVFSTLAFVFGFIRDFFMIFKKREDKIDDLEFKPDDPSEKSDDKKEKSEKKQDDDKQTSNASNKQRKMMSSFMGVLGIKGQKKKQQQKGPSHELKDDWIPAKEKPKKDQNKQSGTNQNNQNEQNKK